VKEPWFDYEEWGGWELEDDYSASEDKIEGRQRWDHKNLLDTDAEDKM
jgi:hypothetical protein